MNKIDIRAIFRHLTAFHVITQKRGNPFRYIAVCVILALAVPFRTLGSTPSVDYSTDTVLIRGRSQSLAVYEPASGALKRPFQIIVTSGDIGWVGLPVVIAEHTRSLGFRTIGFNARAYLSSFTGESEHLDEREIPGDYQAILARGTSDPSLPREVVMIGVSEGAGLTVLGMGQTNSPKGCRGIIALGLPARTSLGWHWTDFPMWITKKDPREPLAETKAYLPGLKIPLVMIHSTRDEWDPIESARALYKLHPGPKRFVAVDAVNHRFSDKRPEVLSQLEKSLEWLQNPIPES